MEKNYDKLDEIIHEYMKIEDTPSIGLNNCLKAELYKQEAQSKKESSIKNIPLWYAPMVFNAIIFSLFAVFSLLAISNSFLSMFVAVICVYIAITGAVITLVGIKRTNLKEELTVHVKKRGIIYE